MQKTIYTLAVDNYVPEICKLTFPLMERYAEKIGAEFKVITERKFLGFPPVYEKLQIYELGKESDWIIYLDADTMVYPDMFDVTDHLGRDTVCFHGMDMAGNRWRYDDYFRRDGRHIGACNWCTIASRWCLDLWRPLDDLSLEEALLNIYPTQAERISNARISRDHLIDDYVLSRNIARYGLKHTTIQEILSKIGQPQAGYFWHQYMISTEEKISEMKAVLELWESTQKLASTLAQDQTLADLVKEEEEKCPLLK